MEVKAFLSEGKCTTYFYPEDILAAELRQELLDLQEFYCRVEIMSVPQYMDIKNLFGGGFSYATK